MDSPSKSTLDGLPKQFVDSLRTLFSALDDGAKGLIKFSDVAKGWQVKVSPDLPPGVIESLQKVTPTNGLLTFERFVAGIKIALLRAKQSATENNNQRNVSIVTASDSSPPPPPPPPRLSKSNENSPEKHLSAFKALGGKSSLHPSTIIRPNSHQLRPSGHPYFETSLLQLQTSQEHAEIGGSHPLLSMNNDPAERIHQWRKETFQDSSIPRIPADGSIDHYDLVSSRETGTGQKAEHSMAAKRNRRREPRRHTLSNGVDHNMIRRLKQLQTEQSILSEGLVLVRRAVVWYENQLEKLRDRQRRVTGGSGDSRLAANEERVQLQAARIHELNLQLKALLDSSEKGWPLHMNLAVVANKNSQNEPTEAENVIAMLKAQNKMLTQEIQHKVEKINVLEKDKSSLVRQVFELRAQSNPVDQDATVMM